MKAYRATSWRLVFGAAAPVVDAAAQSLLTTVDAHLANWRAHGAPLVCAREWRDDRFLVIGVDEAATDATGCSIDGLFHVLRDIESLVGTTLVGGWCGGAGDARVRHDDYHGRCVSRRL